MQRSRNKMEIIHKITDIYQFIFNFIVKKVDFSNNITIIDTLSLFDE